VAVDPKTLYADLEMLLTPRAPAAPAPERNLDGTVAGAFFDVDGGPLDMARGLRDFDYYRRNAPLIQSQLARNRRAADRGEFERTLGVSNRAARERLRRRDEERAADRAAQLQQEADEQETADRRRDSMGKFV